GDDVPLLAKEHRALERRGIRLHGEKGVGRGLRRQVGAPEQLPGLLLDRLQEPALGGAEDEIAVDVAVFVNRMRALVADYERVRAGVAHAPAGALELAFDEGLV